MDKEYFSKYGSGSSFKDSWYYYTFSMKNVFSFFDSIGFQVNSMFDIGAADGSLLDIITDLHPSIKVGGLEVYSKIVPTSKRYMIKIGDIRHHSWTEKWDVCLLNGIPVYLTERDLVAVLKGIPAKYIVTRFELWDAAYLENRSTKHQKIFRTFQWWVKFFNSNGWVIEYLHIDGTWILSRGKANQSSRFSNRQWLLKQTSKGNGTLILDDRVTLTFENKKLLITTSRDVSNRDLTDLAFFVFNLNYNSCVLLGEYKKYVPGWANGPKGYLYPYLIP